jgi:hypothetical protein
METAWKRSTIKMSLQPNRSTNVPSGTDREADRAELSQRTYRQLRERGLSETDIMAFAGDLLALVASDVRIRGAAE